MTINNIYSEPLGGPNELKTLHVSEEERASGKPKMCTVREAVLALNRDGIVVFENAIEMAHIEKLRERMVVDIYELLSRETTHFNSAGREIGNVSQAPPVYPGYIFKDVYANPIAAAVISSMIGPRSEFTWMFGNTAIKSKGDKRQNVHADIRWDYYDFPTGMTLNIMLQDVTPQNGSTEIWLGSHKTSSLKKNTQPTGGGIASEELEKRKAVRPPVYPCIKKGSIILRDTRLWHAGMPNFTDTPRIMVGFIYFPAWYENQMRVEFPKSAKKDIEALGDEFKFVADYIEDDQYDHLAIEFKIDYGPIAES